MEKIDVSRLAGNESANYGSEAQIPYGDIKILADKINEIIDVLEEARIHGVCGKPIDKEGEKC